MFFFFFFFFEYGQAGFSAGHVKKIFLVLRASGIFIICQPLLELLSTISSHENESAEYLAKI